jgi:hypothetical protein
MDPYELPCPVDQLIDDVLQERCPACYGPLYVLGRLGSLIHFRCRDCGTDCSATTED